MPLDVLEIDDGYNQTATAKAKGWPDVVFKFRPALPARVRDHVLACNRARNGDEEMRATAGLLAGQIVSWDVVCHGGPAPVTEQMLLRIPDPILQRMVSIVTGYANEEIEADEKNSKSGSASF